MNASEQIDKYISGITDWRGEMITRLRQLVLEADPEVQEEWKWNSPVWWHNGNVCSASAFKKHVGLNFFHGAYLEDPLHLFNSGLDSKNSRSIKFLEGDPIDEGALADLIRSAVEYNHRNS
jgi:hypothetical protein